MKDDSESKKDVVKSLGESIETTPCAIIKADCSDVISAMDGLDKSIKAKFEEEAKRLTKRQE